MQSATTASEILDAVLVRWWRHRFSAHAHDFARHLLAELSHAALLAAFDATLNEGTPELWSEWCHYYRSAFDVAEPQWRAA